MRKLSIIFLIIIANGITVFAQDSGIQFSRDSSWRQVLEKAKAEHRYIFVDCYASWCGPCMEMATDIYPLKEIGDIYNKDFISVKLQMDKTNHDSEETKSWYDTADDLGGTYFINAYPTFLFFDPDGNPVHKVTGALNAEQFIALAKDAQNPDKQYYSLIKNFQPGKLDTAEEKGLAGVFISSDQQLAGKIAADYLSRLPVDRLNNPYHHYLMRALLDNADMKAWAIGYVTGLNKQQLSHENNLKLVTIFYTIPEVKQVVKKYLDGLRDEQLYTKVNIGYLSLATETPNDKRGFDVFYHHAAKVDEVIKQKGFAHGQTEAEIKKVEFTPLFDAAIQSGITPDFIAITASIAKKYHGDFAEVITIRGKVDWYNHLVYDKKEDKYMPDLIICHIIQVNRFRYDTVKALTTFVNNVAYGEIFLHSDDKSQSLIAAGWMEHVVKHEPKASDLMDTYASLLYKAGEVDKALAWANKALAIVTDKKSDNDMKYETGKIAAMKRGEEIWTEKEYQ